MESIDVGSFMTLCIEGTSGFPLYKLLDWTLTKLDNETLMLTSPKQNPTKTKENPDSVVSTNEFVDFFQNAPIALHWLSGTGE